MFDPSWDCRRFVFPIFVERPSLGLLPYMTPADFGRFQPIEEFDPGPDFFGGTRLL